MIIKYNGFAIIEEKFIDTKGHKRKIVAAIPDGIYPDKDLTIDRANNYWFNQQDPLGWDLFSANDFDEGSQADKEWLNNMKIKIDNYIKELEIL